MLRHFEVFLAFRYLRKKRLAFFCVAAVALSVAMLIVVSSVMGGFVEQLRESCHGFYGDIVVRADSLVGFPYYEEFIVEAKKIEEVQEVTPVIKQYGLLRIDQEHFKLFVKAVEILGIRPEGYSRITNFRESLWRPSGWKGPVSLEVPQGYSWEVEPAGACIVGAQVVYNRKDDGEFHRQIELYDSQVVLAMLPLSRRTGMFESKLPRRAFVLIADSETAVPLVDDHTVYIDFNAAQNMSQMVEHKNTRTGKVTPARTSEVRLKTTEGADLAEIEKKLEAIWSEIVLQKKYLGQDVVIETWNEQGGIASLIAQLERDRTLMTILFAIMDVVCVFLILSIFYVIITEKIPDIGIIKSIGASGSGVGRVFFSYALAVGVFGALLGLAIGWPFVVNINQIHNWVAETFGWRVYDSSVLLFPDIPNQMDWAATLKIMIASVLACLVGSMIPAIRAVMMKPIKALRYE